jgi:UDP-glucose 4-epimerase
MYKSAIVTGASGYIGSVLCKLLKENDYIVTGFDLESRELHRTKYCDLFYETDFTSDFALDILKKQSNATVFHLAANSLLGPSAYDPLSYYNNNTVKTLTLIKALQPSNKFVFASTAAVYGHIHGDNLPKYEISPINPPNNYGWSKYFTEKILDTSYKICNIRATSFRFFNVIGAHDNVGQQKNTPHIINKLCEASRNNKTFSIYGNKWNTRDGTCVRDYIHVFDVCNALIHADKFMEDKINCHYKFNLGTKHGTSVKEIVDIFRVVGYDVNVEVIEPRLGDPACLIANPSLFCSTTNFKYKFDHNDLPEIIANAYNYYNKYY